MKTYRIKEYQFYKSNSYLVQRKSIFGFWYNEDNVDAYTTGWHDSLEEAIESIKRKTTSTSNKVVYP